MTFGKQWQSPVNRSQWGCSGSVPKTLHSQLTHIPLTASPWNPSRQNSQWSPSVLKRHLRHSPVCGSQFPVSSKFQLLEQLQLTQEPPGISGLPWKLSEQMEQRAPGQREQENLVILTNSFLFRSIFSHLSILRRIHRRVHCWPCLDSTCRQRSGRLPLCWDKGTPDKGCQHRAC